MSGDFGAQLEFKVLQMEKTQGAQSLGFADTLMDAADVYASAGKYVEAERYYWRALEIRRKIVGESHLKVAEVLTSLAEIYETCEQFPEAERLYRWVLKIKERVSGRKSPDVAVTLESLARVLRALDNNFEATELEAEAQAIWFKAPTIEDQ